MATRKSLSRRRILAGVIAPTALGVAAAVAVALPQQENPTVGDPELVGMASTAECHDLVSLGIGGRGDIPKNESLMLVDGEGNRLPAAQQGAYRSHWVEPVISAPLKDYEEDDGYAAIYIEYPADLGSYEEAVNTGAANTIEVIQAIQTSCPGTQIAIVGFSEGADVARRAAMQIGAQEQAEDGSWALVDPDMIQGVVILSDAGRSAGDGFFPGSTNGSSPNGYDVPFLPDGEPVPGRGLLPNTYGDFGSLEGRVASFCSEGDFTCSAPENIALIELLINVGRQVDADALEREGLTPATGADLAQVVGRVALLALADISSQENWMQSDETFLEVLIKVSDPDYDPRTTQPVTSVAADDKSDDEAAETPIPADRLANLAYLPEKIVKEVVGFISSNQNTLAVALSDPYEQTFGYTDERGHYGHHFDYWDRNSGPSAAEYAAGWLTHLAKEAKEGRKVEPQNVDKAAVLTVLENEALEEDATEATTGTEGAPTGGVSTVEDTTTDVTTPVQTESGPVVSQPAPPATGEVPATPVAPTTPVAPAPGDGAPIDGAPAESSPAEGATTTDPADTTAESGTSTPSSTASTTTTTTPVPSGS